MGRILYVVAREHPLLCGYLMAKVDARSPDGHSVEIKLDERRGERRTEHGTGRAPERRRGEQRRRPSLASELHTRGYATVLLDGTPRSRAAAPALGWRPRSTRGRRAARAWRRQGMRWALPAGVLLAALALTIVVARSIPPTAKSSPGGGFGPGQPAPPVAEEAPPASPPLRPMPRAAAARTPAPVTPSRVSGVVLSVDLKARALVIQDMGADAEARRLRVGLAPDARVVLSERESPATEFRDSTISLSDIRDGDFVVVDLKRSEGAPLARSVVVTLRAGQGAGRPGRQ